MLTVVRFTSYACSKLVESGAFFSIGCHSATLWPTITGFAQSPLGIALYHIPAFRKKLLHGSARNCKKRQKRLRRIQLKRAADLNIRGQKSEYESCSARVDASVYISFIAVGHTVHQLRAFKVCIFNRVPQRHRLVNSHGLRIITVWHKPLPDYRVSRKPTARFSQNSCFWRKNKKKKKKNQKKNTVSYNKGLELDARSLKYSCEQR